MPSIASVAEYQQYKIIVSSPNDTLYNEAAIQAFLDAASDYFESQCYQAMRQQEFDENETLGTTYCSINPRGWINVFPRRFPIVSIDTLEYRTSPSADFTEIPSTAYTFNDQGRIIVPTPVPFLSPYQYAEFHLVYTAGFADDEMPKDVKMAVIYLAAFFASGGYAALDVNWQSAKAVVPKWAWDIINSTIDKYGRQF